MTTTKKVSLIIATSLATIVLSLALISFQSPNFKTSKSLEIFFSFFRDLNILYVDSTDPEELMQTGIDAMLQSLDPYSEFISEENRDDLEFQTTGEYGGMGALVQETEGFPMVAEIYEGSPAHKAGLFVGDKIVSINGINVKGIKVDKASKLLKGTPKSTLDLKITRNSSSDTLTFSFSREKIHIPSVTYHGIVGSNIGYLRLSGFTAETYRETENAVKELVDKYKAKSLIVDLRGNPGGLLYEAVRVVNLFVPRNQLVVFTKGQIKDFDQEYKTAARPLNTEIPIVVLVDRLSASASEIVAGALQDLDRAVIIGERTFGKGLVQTTRDLPYNTKIKITTAKYYIPSGRCIQAIDFAKRNEDGSIHYIPDSLMKPFKTVNGRTVLDGGGILPDIQHSVKGYNRFITSLYTGRMFFNYANSYRIANEKISPASAFSLTNSDFEDFKKFVANQKFEYQTQTERMLAEVIKASKEEEFYAQTQSIIDSLNSMVKGNVANEIDRNRDDVTTLLEEEIVSRYYYQSGRFERFVNRDEMVAKAVEVLKDEAKFKSILNPGVVTK